MRPLFKPREVQKESTISFLEGWFLAWAFHSLHTDVLGLDGYIEFVRAHWTEPKTSVPISILFVATVITYRGTRSRKLREDSDDDE